jgi:hypothetical protein
MRADELRFCLGVLHNDGAAITLVGFWFRIHCSLPITTQT